MRCPTPRFTATACRAPTRRSPPARWRSPHPVAVAGPAAGRARRSVPPRHLNQGGDVGRTEWGNWSLSYKPPGYEVDENGKIIGYVNDRKPNNWGRWGEL